MLRNNGILTVETNFDKSKIKPRLIGMFNNIKRIFNNIKFIQEENTNNLDNTNIDNSDYKKEKTINNSDSFSNIKNPNVFIELTLNGIKYGKIECELYDNIVPKTSKNFRSLCEQKMYLETPFHRIVNNSFIHGGDFTHKDGSGGRSIYGEKFEDENFELTHDGPGILSMANRGPNTNGSQFYITLDKVEDLDNKNVVFGKIVKGFDIIQKVSKLPSDFENRPYDKLLISDCGLVNNSSNDNEIKSEEQNNSL